jgi:hypothetical protein
MLPKTKWPDLVHTLQDTGLIFRASLSQKKDKALQNRDHINLTAFDILLNLNITTYGPDKRVATKDDARRQPLFCLMTVHQVKDQRIGKAHMLTITHHYDVDVEAWGYNLLQQRYPNKKVGDPDSDVDSNENPINTIFLIGASIYLLFCAY